MTEQQGGGFEKFFECKGRVKPGLTYPELLFSLNEEKTILEELLNTSCLLKMSRSILDYKYRGYLILRFCSDVEKEANLIITENWPL